MSSSMIYWVDTFNVDGFRCDVAHEVLQSFGTMLQSLLEK